MDEITDRKGQEMLVRAAAQGDRDAFVRLIDRYRRSMYAAAMSVTGREDDALDAIQDAILIMWEKLDCLRDPSAFQTWMTRILVNRCRDLLRRRKREIPVEDPETELPEHDRDLSMDVARAMDRLSGDDKLLLQLFYFDGMSVKEIAAALDLSPEAVRMRLSRSRKRFKAQYEKEGLL